MISYSKGMFLLMIMDCVKNVMTEQGVNSFYLEVLRKLENEICLTLGTGRKLCTNVIL